MAKRQINKRLTREMLEEMGIYEVYYDNDTQEWWINRCWKTCYKGEEVYKRIPVVEATTKHKYAKSKTYPIVAFSYQSKTHSYPLSRFIYAWFKGEIGEGMVVDHIDNNPYNNCPLNLQALTPEENLIKRYSDNPNSHKNQYK